MKRISTKLYLTHIIVLLFLSLSAQEKTIYGRVLDKQTGQGIPGVYLLQHGDPVSFTNERGIFELVCDPKKEKEVVFYHLGYEPDKISLSKLKSDTATIRLKEKNFGMSEIKVTGIDLQELVKKASRRYTRTYHDFCFWAKSNYKQVSHYAGRCHSYFECDGYHYFPKVDSRFAFGGAPDIVPGEVRRTHQGGYNGAEGSLSDKNKIVDPSCNSVALGFFECLHPLYRTREKLYHFNLSGTDTLASDTEIVLIYKAKGAANVGGNIIHGQKGKIWIDSRTFAIKRIEGIFGWNNYRFHELSISYTEIGGVCFPDKYNIKGIYTDNLKNGELRKFLVESETELKEIYTKPQAEYSKGTYYSISSILEDYPYHADYWNKQPLPEEKWLKYIDELSKGNPDAEFEQGARQELKSEKKHSAKKFRNSSLEFVKQMKQDLKLE